MLNFFFKKKKTVFPEHPPGSWLLWISWPKSQISAVHKHGDEGRDGWTGAYTGFFLEGISIDTRDPTLPFPPVYPAPPVYASLARYKVYLQTGYCIEMKKKPTY